MRSQLRLALRALLSVAALGCDGPPAPGNQAVETDSAVVADLTVLERRWAAAAVARDRAVLDDVMAPEWTITLSNGQRSDKARALARWTRPLAPGVVREVSVVDSIQVQRLAPDAAVVTAAITDIEVKAAAADTTRTRVTDIFVRRDGRWRVTLSHESVRTPP